MPAPRNFRYYLFDDQDPQKRPVRRKRPIRRPPDPKWIDIELIHTWIRECDTKHGDHCQRSRLPGESHLGLPRWLINVKTKCLVPFDPACRYVALSYVWGTTDSNEPQLLLDNLLAFQEVGSLETIWEQLPRTIRHSIDFVRQIGEEYLWVDRLCIVQDDDASKQEQIRHMAFIYGSAYFTLIAAAAWRAAEGLKGIKDVTPPMISDRWSAEGHYGLVARSAWNRRGWTLQELVFSQRSLFFHDNEVTWECHCAVWHERTPLEDLSIKNCLGTYAPHTRGFHYSHWPNLEDFYQLAASYSRRELTFPTDILPAFAGITTALTRSFPGGFLFGHPEVAFDVALLWRTTGGASFRHQLGAASVPSWSWMFCLYLETSADFSPWASAFSYLDRSHFNEDRQQRYGSASWTRKSPPEGLLNGLVTKSFCTWYVKETIGNRRISNDLDGFKGCSLDPALELPQGWQKDGNLFHHPCDPERRFKYPIPLVADGEDGELMKETPFFIMCKTERAWFWNIPVPYRLAVDKLEEEAVINLYDSEETWVGCLRVHTRIVLWRLLCKREKCELAAISTGSIDSTAGGWTRLDEYPELKNQNRELFEFYNVLFVEWKDGVAHRQGVGRVDKSAWGRQSREELELVLG
ncbi:HET domain-containing protein [Fusarium sp. Ph1]|nr:HET domain-containing protein [Fusarium sp. Ph1]